MAVSTAFADQRILSVTELAGPGADEARAKAPSMSAERDARLPADFPARRAITAQQVQSEISLGGQSKSFEPPKVVSTGPNSPLLTTPVELATVRPTPPVSRVDSAPVDAIIVTETEIVGIPNSDRPARTTGISGPRVLSQTVVGSVVSAEVVIRDRLATPPSESPIARENPPEAINRSNELLVQVPEQESRIPAPMGTPIVNDPAATRIESAPSRIIEAPTPKVATPQSPEPPTGIAVVEEPPASEPPKGSEPPVSAPVEVTIVLPPEPPKEPMPIVAEPLISPNRNEDPIAPNVTARSDSPQLPQPERSYTVDDPFMISQMNPNRRLQETDLPLFDESMPVIDDDIARLQLRQWHDLVLSAVESNPATRVALFSERAAAAGVDERASALYPQVSLGVSGAVERSVRDGERVPSLTGMEADDRLQVSPELTIRQLLFDGGATRSRVNAAEGQRTVASKQRKATEQNVAIQAVETLIALAKTQEQLQIAEEHLNEVERIRDMTRERVNAGRDAPSEIISINARVFEARNRIREIQTEQAAATAEFREVFAAPPVILAFPDVFAPIPMNPRTGFDMAMAFNPEIQASQAAIDVALAEFDASKGDGLPRIEVEASATGFDTFNRGGDYYDSSVGLRMTADLFDGGRQEAAVQRALNNLEGARFRHDQTVNAVERIINAAYSERVNLIPQFKASQAKRDQEIASREAYVEQWLAGRRPLNDLLAAQDRVFQNSLESIELKSELHRQHFFILSLIGDLDKPIR